MIRDLDPDFLFFFLPKICSLAGLLSIRGENRFFTDGLLSLAASENLFLLAVKIYFC